MNNDPVGTFKTGNTTWHVRVQADHRFYAEAPGFTGVSGKSWEDMENAAKVAAHKAKIKVAVPYMEVSTPGIRGEVRFSQYTATGIHSANGNVLRTDSHGYTSQADRYIRNAYKPMAAEDQAEYADLYRKITELNIQLDAIKYRYAFQDGLKSAVQDAIDAEHASRAEAEASDV